MIDPKSYILGRINHQANGCWLWSLTVNSWGYGRIGKTILGERAAHRLAYRAFVGPIPEGLRVLHNCPGGDNSRCCNPEHLFLGTDADNMRDMVSKGRNADNRGERGPAAKLTEEDVRTIRVECGSTTISELARRFGVSRRAIRFAITGITWSSV